MSVLSRPTHRRATAPTQREERIPLPRTSPEPSASALRLRPQTSQPSPAVDRRTRTIMVVGGGLVVALAIGVGTYAVLDDGGTSVVAPSVPRAPSTADLGRDAAAAARGVDSGFTTRSDAARLTEAQRDAALARRAQN